LRSLYFLLAGIVDKFHYLKLGLSAVLVFVGVKMVLVDIYKIPIGLSLAVIASILTISIIASLRRARRLLELEKDPEPEAYNRFNKDALFDNLVSVLIGINTRWAL
jgi:tellurite resistance protein TerC